MAALEGASKRPAESEAAPGAAKAPCTTPATPRSTYEEIVGLAYAAAEHDVDRSVLYEEHHAPTDAVLVPASVHYNTSAPQARGLTNAAAVSQEFLWRWTPGTPFDFTAAAMKLCNELHKAPDLEAGVQAELAFTLHRLHECNDALGARCMQDTSLRLQVAVPLDGNLLRDTVIWDVAQPYNTPEVYAAAVCEDLGLRYNWFCAISAHMQQLLSDVREEFRREGDTTLPLVDPSESGVVDPLAASPLAGGKRPQGPLSTPILPKALAHIPPKPPQPPKPPKARPPSAQVPPVPTFAEAQRGEQGVRAVSVALRVTDDAVGVELHVGAARGASKRTPRGESAGEAARAAASDAAVKNEPHGPRGPARPPPDVEMAGGHEAPTSSAAGVTAEAAPGAASEQGDEKAEAGAVGSGDACAAREGGEQPGSHATSSATGTARQQEHAASQADGAQASAAAAGTPAPGGRDTLAPTEEEQERADQAALDSLGRVADDADVAAAQREWFAHPALRVPEIIAYAEEHDAGIAWRKRMAALRRRWQVVADVEAKRAARKAARERAEKSEAERQRAAAEAKAKADAEAADAKQRDAAQSQADADVPVAAAPAPQSAQQPPAQQQPLQRQPLHPPATVQQPVQQAAAAAGTAAWPRLAAHSEQAKWTPEEEAKYQGMLQQRLNKRPPGQAVQHAPAAGAAQPAAAAAQQPQQGSTAQGHPGQQNAPR